MLGGRGPKAAGPTGLGGAAAPSPGVGRAHGVRVLLSELLLALVDVGEGGGALQSSTQQEWLWRRRLRHGRACRGHGDSVNPKGRRSTGQKLAS